MVVYPEAGHSFETVGGHGQYRPDDAADAWKRDKAFLAANLKSGIVLGERQPAQSPQAPSQAAEPSTAEIERQIIDNERAIAVGFLKHDASVAERFFTDDFREIVPSGRIFTKPDNVREAANSDFVQIDILEPSVHVVKGDASIRRGTSKVARNRRPRSRSPGPFGFWWFGFSATESGKSWQARIARSRELCNTPGPFIDLDLTIALGRR